MAGRRNSSRALAKATHLVALLINLSRLKHGRRRRPEVARPLPALAGSARHGVGQGWILAPNRVKANLLCRVESLAVWV